MARNRVFYQSESVFAGPDGATGVHVDLVQGDDNLLEENNNIKRLQRIQSANYSFTIDRTDVNQFGELAAIDRIILTSPTVSMDFSYILANMANESILGFDIDGTNSAIANILDKSKDERNYFIKTSAEGVDNIGSEVSTAKTDTKLDGVIGIGNGFMTSYTAEGAVGDFPTASVSVEGLNMTFDQNTSGNIIPGIDPTDGSKISWLTYVLPTGMNSALSTTVVGSNSTDLTTALRPGDITFDLVPAGGAGEVDFAGMGSVDSANLQSFSCSFDMTRTPIEKLGSRFAFSREIDFPITVTFTIDAVLGDLTNGNLSDIVDADSSYDISVDLKGKDVNDSSNASKAKYTVKKAKLDSQEFTSDIGSNKSVSLTFSAQVGGPNQSDVGLFMNGVNS
jgi:hypothetical protein